MKKGWVGWGSLEGAFDRVVLSEMTVSGKCSN